MRQRSLASSLRARTPQLGTLSFSPSASPSCIGICGPARLPAVYEFVGKDRFFKSLDCLRPFAMMVSFGAASGLVGPVDLGIFAQKGSLFFNAPDAQHLCGQARRLRGDGEGSL
jgi:hypothetical protein